MTQQPEALRLADNAEKAGAHAIAAELRRLHDENEVLKPWRDTVYRVHDALKDAGWHPGRTDDLITDIIKAKGDEMRRLHALNVDKTEIIASHVANYERLRAVNAQLLEALESIELWMDDQADGQSKGGHATFDLLMLREQRDIARAAIAAAKEQA